MKDKPKDIAFHYTNEQMVKDLISITPISGSVLDAGSGKNKVWFNNLIGEKYECEIEDGVDFLQWDKKVDWVIGNPPYHIGWQFTEKASQITNKGFAWLVNNTEMNSLLTPRRLQIISDNGFTLKSIKVVADKRWFGRYYYLIFTKEQNNFLSWERKTY
jgi:hypothetical protein